MSESKQELYFGGIPTDPDVRRLREHYPDGEMSEGDFIPYTDVAELIHCGRKTDRFKTVTSRWRKIVEKESGHVIGTRPGEGFVVLSDPEKVDLSGAKLRTAFRHTRRSMVVSGRVERKNLDAAEAERLDHIDAVAARLAETARLAAKSDLPKLTE